MVTRKLFTVDFETHYDLKTYSLSKMSTESYIRDPRFQIIGVGVAEGGDAPTWHPGAEAEPYLRSLDLDQHNVVCHHTAFDGAILAWKLGIKPKYYFDTLSMARPVTGLTVGGSLKALAQKFCLGEKGDATKWANGMRLEDFTPAQLEEYGEYCKNDVRLTYLLFQILKAYSTPQEMYVIDMLLRMYTDPVLGLNERVLTDHLARVRAAKIKLMSQIDSQVDRAMLRSDPQFAAILESFGVEPPTKINKKGVEKFAFANTDEEFKALAEHPDGRVQCLVAARLGVKTTIEESRTEAFLGIAARGTLPIMLNYYGAHTGRASGGDKINPQNMTRGGALRRSILAPYYHTIVAGDSSQIEARLLAWFAGEFELVSDFRSGVDTYCKFATDVYNREVTKANINERFLGKTCILGLGYMTGHKKLRGTLAVGRSPVKVDVVEAKRIVNLYRSRFTMIVNLWDLADEALNAMVNGYERDFGLQHMKLHCSNEGIALPNGMMLRYPNLRRGRFGVTYDSRRGPVTLYGGKMVENVIQALARIIVFNQMGKMDQWLRPLDANAAELQRTHAAEADYEPIELPWRFKLAHTVHDEIVTVVPVPYEERTKTMLGKIMSQTPSWSAGLPITCEVKSGLTYGDCK
jgi:DNA polymerase I-like protein with 3'-5' exonuclease and polymerase domains